MDKSFLNVWFSFNLVWFSILAVSKLMQTYMAEAFRQKPYRSIQNMGSAQLRGNGLLNYPRRNHVDSQIDWREDPTITPLRRLLRNRM